MWEKVKYIMIFENGGQILNFLQKTFTTSWKITKKTEENVWSKILLYAKRNKLYSFVEEASHQMSENFRKYLSKRKKFFVVSTIK